MLLQVFNETVNHSRIYKNIKMKNRKSGYSTDDIKSSFLKLLVFPFVLCVLFIGLKLEEKIKWNWGFVLSPLIIYLAVNGYMYQMAKTREKSEREQLRNKLKSNPELINEMPTIKEGESSELFAKRVDEFRKLHIANLE